MASTRRRISRLYAVTRPDWPEDQHTVIVEARDRETAKDLAHALPGMGRDKESYVVEPLPVPLGINRVVWKGPGQGGSTS